MAIGVSRWSTGRRFGSCDGRVVARGTGAGVVSAVAGAGGGEGAPLGGTAGDSGGLSTRAISTEPCFLRCDLPLPAWVSGARPGRMTRGLPDSWSEPAAFQVRGPTTGGSAALAGSSVAV